MIITVLGDAFEVSRPTACCLLDVMQPSPSITGAVKSLKKISVRTDSPGVVARFENKNIVAQNVVK